MKRKISIGIVASMMGATVWAVCPWTWTGNGANDNWSNTDNWEYPGSCGARTYPNSTDDDVTISVDYSLDIVLTEVTIDDLTVENLSDEGISLVGLDGNNSETELTADSVTLFAGDYALRVTAKNGGRLLTE